MSIQSVIGNTVKSVGDTVDSVVNQVHSKLEAIVGSTTTGLSNLYSGGFVGMSKDGMNELVTAVNNYCTEVESVINEFNDEASRAEAYKGQISEAVGQYVTSMKKMLTAYVSQIRKETEEAAAAYKAMHQSDTSISSDVESDATNIVQDAESIRVESTNVSLD